MSFYAILCAALSLASGLLGFKFASELDIGNLPAYIFSLSISYLLSAGCTMIAIRGKSRYIILANYGVDHMHFSTRSLLASASAFAVGLTASLILLYLSGASFALLVFIQGLIVTGQFLTFDVSNLTQIVDNPRFWRFQTVGAFVRVSVIVLGFLIFSPNFVILASSSAVAAFAIAICYRLRPSDFLRRNLSIRTALYRIGFSFSPDSAWRSARMTSEQFMVTTTALVARWTAPAGAGEAALLVAPYLNAAFTSFHQALNKFEISMIRGEQSSKHITAMIAGFTVLAASVYPLLIFFPVLKSILPTPTRASFEELSVALTASIISVPFCLGYGVADLFPLHNLKKIIINTAIFWALSVLTIFAIGAVVPFAFLALMAVPSLAIGWGMQRSRRAIFNK